MCISFLSGSPISIQFHVNFALYTFCTTHSRENHNTIANNICSQGFNYLNLDDTDSQVLLSIKFQFINSHIKSKKI